LRPDKFQSTKRVALAMAGVAALAAPVGAQSADAPSSDHILITSSVPGAKPLPQPKWDTPVAPQYQESYQAFLKMYRDAKGGTKYTRADYAKMPDWSGVWTRTGGFNWNSPPVVERQAAGIGPEAAQALLKD
jgi:hypothetical protein